MWAHVGPQPEPQTFSPKSSADPQNHRKIKGLAIFGEKCLWAAWAHVGPHGPFFVRVHLSGLGQRFRFATRFIAHFKDLNEICNMR